MKFLMILADRFEDVEAIATLDVLLRGKDEVDTVSMMSNKEVKTKSGHVFIANKHYLEISLTDYDALIIPGGPASFTILSELNIVNEYIDYFVLNNKLVAAICAAPFLVGRRGYYKDRKFTVHPGFEDRITLGTYLRDVPVVVDGPFITAKSMYFSIDFALAIHSYYHGTNSRDALKKSLQGE